MSTRLTPVLRDAGWALAHAMCSIELGGTLCTLAAVTFADTRTIYRYSAPSIPASLAGAYQHLTEELVPGAHAALVFDGFVSSSTQERTDALIVEILGPRAERLGTVTQAYVPGRRFGLPLVGRRLSLVGGLGIERSIDHDDPESSIYEGVRQHPHGARIFGLTTEG